MFFRPHILFALAGLAMATAAQAQTSAQYHRPDRDGYPCSTQERLAVVQDDQGFSITAATKPVLKAVVPIGTGLTLDRALFGDTTARSKEASDAPRR